jgi:hypothetical protein
MQPVPSWLLKRQQPLPDDSWLRQTGAWGHFTQRFHWQGFPSRGPGDTSRGGLGTFHATLSLASFSFGMFLLWCPGQAQRRAAAERSLPALVRRWQAAVLPFDVGRFLYPLRPGVPAWRPQACEVGQILRVGQEAAVEGRVVPLRQCDDPDPQ